MPQLVSGRFSVGRPPSRKCPDLSTDAVSGFAQPGEPIDLENCAREPIHLAGAVQAQGAVLVARMSDRVIVQSSANCHAVLGLAPRR